MRPAFRSTCVFTSPDCGYAALPQCNATASSRAAQCLVNPYPNPYFASSGVVERSARHRRHSRRRYSASSGDRGDMSPSLSVMAKHRKWIGDAGNQDL
jgi:hypothetical protein